MDNKVNNRKKQRTKRLRVMFIPLVIILVLIAILMLRSSLLPLILISIIGLFGYGFYVGSNHKYESVCDALELIGVKRIQISDAINKMYDEDDDFYKNNN